MFFCIIIIIKDFLYIKWGKKLITFFFFAIVIILGVIFFTRNKKAKSGNWIQFFSRGKELGFNMREMEQLRQLVTSCEIKDPVSIFRSQKHFETVIRAMVHTVRMSGEINDSATQEYLSKLFDYCKKLQMEATDSRMRITTSRQISEGQVLRVLVPGTGVYNSELVRNFSNYLTISRPVNSKLTSAMQWQGIKISIYFWRENDAGYVFDSEVVDEVFSKGISSLKIEHNDSLFRTQKRKSLRIKFVKPAFLYLLNDNDSPHQLEKSAGLRCMLDDISDTGCAFKINGHATSGLRLKVQFSMNRVPICIPGTVRSVDYNENANVSLVHMEADKLPNETRNHILCEVFDVLPEDEDGDDEMPFRVLEEEADAPLRNDKKGALNA